MWWNCVNVKILMLRSSNHLAFRAAFTSTHTIVCGYAVRVGGAKMTTESCRNAATTLSRMNISEHVGHVIIFSWNAQYCLTFTSRVRIRVRIRFSVWLVSSYAHIFELLSVVVVTLSYKRSLRRYAPSKWRRCQYRWQNVVTGTPCMTAVRRCFDAVWYRGISRIPPSVPHYFRRVRAARTILRPETVHQCAGRDFYWRRTPATLIDRLRLLNISERLLRARRTSADQQSLCADV